ncbi:DUF3486 family protein [Leisingera sp. M658]|uniref:DUF3486 family protein n=1 Tax=Leisingera sp. M658 TaxID=2867015 RepID=UPI0021A512D5|nr:DUF3486 family protein [Leisingera sp. M658]UWQ76817.1 DUF3486 family protein [Leisingera sp. M658]
MPRPRKINMAPAEVRDWLKEALRDSGWSGYERITEDLNAKLQEEGIELQIGKSAVHEYGQEYREFVKYQEQASQWAESWMTDNGLEEEAQRHNVLFQMLTTLAFKFMQQEMGKENGEIDPRELHFIGKMMKDVMASSGIREKLMDDERGRIALKAKEEAAGDMAKAATQLGMTAETVEAIREQILFGGKR